MSEKQIADDVVDALRRDHKIYNICITDHMNYQVTRAADTADKWDRDDNHTDHKFTGFRVVDSSIPSDLAIGYRPRLNRIYYLVVVVYSTGDSFGHDSGGGVEYIELYKTEAEAQDTKQAIEAQNHNYRTSTGTRLDCLIKNSTSKEYDLYCGAWQGYFESLDYVNVIPMEHE